MKKNLTALICLCLVAATIWGAGNLLAKYTADAVGQFVLDVTARYRLIFHWNGDDGDNTTDDNYEIYQMRKLASNKFNIPQDIFYTVDELSPRNLFTLLGWSRDPEATKPEYPQGSEIAVTAAVTHLYAVWNPLPDHNDLSDFNAGRDYSVVDAAAYVQDDKHIDLTINPSAGAERFFFPIYVERNAKYQISFNFTWEGAGLYRYEYPDRPDDRGAIQQAFGWDIVNPSQRTMLYTNCDKPINQADALSNQFHLDVPGFIDLWDGIYNANPFTSDDHNNRVDVSQHQYISRTLEPDYVNEIADRQATSIDKSKPYELCTKYFIESNNAHQIADAAQGFTGFTCGGSAAAGDDTNGDGIGEKYGTMYLFFDFSDVVDRHEVTPSKNGSVKLWDTTSHFTITDIQITKVTEDVQAVDLTDFEFIRYNGSNTSTATVNTPGQYIDHSQNDQYLSFRKDESGNLIPEYYAHDGNNLGFTLKGGSGHERVYIKLPQLVKGQDYTLSFEMLGYIGRRYATNSVYGFQIVADTKVGISDPNIAGIDIKSWEPLAETSPTRDNKNNIQLYNSTDNTYSLQGIELNVYDRAGNYLPAYSNNPSNPKPTPYNRPGVVPDYYEHGFTATSETMYLVFSFSDGQDWYNSRNETEGGGAVLNGIGYKHPDNASTFQNRTAAWPIGIAHLMLTKGKTSPKNPEPSDTVGAWPWNETMGANEDDHIFHITYDDTWKVYDYSRSKYQFVSLNYVHSRAGTLKANRPFNSTILINPRVDELLYWGWIACKTEQAEMKCTFGYQINYCKENNNTVTNWGPIVRDPSFITAWMSEDALDGYMDMFKEIKWIERFTVMIPMEEVRGNCQIRIFCMHKDTIWKIEEFYIRR